VSDTVTRGIRVHVKSTFVPERSAPEQGEYFFAYTVRIANEGEETAQLVSRRWVITNGEGRVEIVEGPGVVGEQPVLTPGTFFEYTSFCPLPTPFGSMEGTYRMITPGGDRFEATIAPFTLAVPTALN
jgi:ApaG protein